MRENGKFNAVVMKRIFETKMAAGALYRSELAFQLTQMGFEVRPRGTSFEIVGVPEDVVQHFSKRRKQIEAKLRSYGHSSARASETATKVTRPAKRKVSEEERLSVWREEAKALGFDAEAVERLKTGNIPKEVPLEVRVKTVTEILHGMLFTESNVRERDLVRRVAESTVSLGWSAAHRGEVHTEGCSPLQVPRSRRHAHAHGASDHFRATA